MPSLTYQYLVDTAGTQFAQDLIARGLATGDGAPSYQDISDRVLEATIQRGRPGELDAFGAGKMTLLLRNDDGRFTPDNSSSPLYGALEPGAMVKARVAVPDYTGLVSWWDLEEAAASTRYDSFGTNHLSPAAAGTVTQVAGIVGHAAQFDGTNYLSAPSSAGLQAVNLDWTVCAWFYISAFTSAGAICAKYNLSTTGQWLLYVDGATQLCKLVVYDGSATDTVTASSFGTLSTGQWYFVMAFHDSVNDVIGISINNGAVDTKAHATGVYTGVARDFTVGSDASGIYYFNGRIDSVSFWNKVLPSVTVANVITTLLYDTFTDTNGTLLTAHTPETGGPWADLTAAHQIQSGYARRSGAANPPFSVVDVAKADVSGTATVRTSAFRQVEIILRATNASNLWRLFFTNNGTTQIIYELNAGVLTSRASAAPAITAGVDYTLTFSAIGNTITFTVDGISTISYASATFNNTATKHGVASNTDTNGAGFDVIQITG